jgi:PDZ domain-containing protein
VLIQLSVVFFILAPSPYIVEKPGPVANVLGKYHDQEIITLLNEEGHEFDNSVSQSEILLLTVSVYGGPENYASSLFVIPALFNHDEKVLPQEAVFPANTTRQDATYQTKSQMTDSQSSSELAAHQYLLSHPDFIASPPLNWSSKIQAESIGGPSAGLAFSLGILKKLGANIAQNKKVAVTGTIDQNGQVGPIGGVQQKMLSASKEGADILLVPVENFAELHNIPQNLEVHAVSSLEQAIDLLK